MEMVDLTPQLPYGTARFKQLFLDVPRAGVAASFGSSADSASCSSPRLQSGPIAKKLMAEADKRDSYGSAGTCRRVDQKIQRQHLADKNW